MLKMSIACFAASVAFASGVQAGLTEGGGGEIIAETFVLPPIQLTDDVANQVRVIRQRGNGSGGGGGGNTEPGGGGGNGTPAPPPNPYQFGAKTNFQAEIQNRLGRSTDFLIIDIIPDPLGDYAPGEFEMLSFDTAAGFGIEALSEEGETEPVAFDAEFLRDGTRVKIDFTGEDIFDVGEAMNFLFTINNDADRELALGLRFTVPTPGSTALLGVAGFFIARRKR